MDNQINHPPTQKDRAISRRALLKAITATSSALMASTILPKQWHEPIVEIGYLPAHAQGSVDNDDDDERPGIFVLSNLQRTMISLNGCSGPQNQVGSLFEISFDYRNSSGNLNKDSVIYQSSIFAPSNRETTFSPANFTLTGNEVRGSVRYTVCTGFGSDTSVTTTVYMVDKDGRQSNTISTVINRPDDAKISGEAYETPSK